MNRHYLSAALFIFAGAVFLYIGLRAEPRQTTWIILGPVFLILGLMRLAGARRQAASRTPPT